MKTTPILGSSSAHEERLRNAAGPEGLPSVRSDHPPTTMGVGEVFLESVSTGVITAQEIDWITAQQSRFNRQEEATVLKLGRLLDAGVIQIGCRLLRR
jgi:hypothetical protein